MIEDRLAVFPLRELIQNSKRASRMREGIIASGDAGSGMLTSPVLITIMLIIPPKSNRARYNVPGAFAEMGCRGTQSPSEYKAQMRFHACS